MAKRNTYKLDSAELRALQECAENFGPHGLSTLKALILEAEAITITNRAKAAA
jgi:hypothetical protein